MKYEICSYITYDRSLTIDFIFYDCGEDIGWRIYIISPIDYKGRNTSYHETHRLHFEKDTYPCICWRGNLTTLEQAKTVASFWADVTAQYIKGYGSFDDITSRQS